ncbi:Transcriptional regulator ATRX-like [Papilio xuthus]|uniref:Transcriptional regulator ATRX-like n=1 Tax=Papilio xuthus TaxID=66420 RepID=A0A194QGE1_PAPXU|nr:Transcriptional regulator ATRX-like [Papilio xuthus]
MIQVKNNVQSEKEISHKSDAITDLKTINNAEKLISLCLHKIKHIFNNTHQNIDTVQKTSISLPYDKVSSLKMLCYRQMVKHFFSFNIIQEINNTRIKEKECSNLIHNKKNTSLLFLSPNTKLEFDKNINAANSASTMRTVTPLQTLCYHTIIQNLTFAKKDEKLGKKPCHKVNTLLTLSLEVIRCCRKNNVTYKRPNKDNNNKGNKTVSKHQVDTLLSLCLNVIRRNQGTDISSVKKINELKGETITASTKQGKTIDYIDNCHNLSMKQSNQLNYKNDKIEHFTPKSLKQIALSYLLSIKTNSENMDSGNLNSKIENPSCILTNNDNGLEQFENICEVGNCLIESVQYASNPVCVKSLFQLCSEKVKLIYQSENELIQNSACSSIQINSVNTVPEEVFFSFQDVTSNPEECNVNNDDEGGTYDDNLLDYGEEETHIEDCNVESKQLVEEIFPPTETDDFNCIDHREDSLTAVISNISSLAQIKIEPIENYMQDVVEVKTEPDHEPILMPRIQCIQAAKLENCFDSPNITSEVLSNFGNNFDSFESTLNRKGTEEVVGEKTNDEQKVFSQSSLRIRRQFEPDSDDDNDNTMSLLVPNSYEPLDDEIIRNIMPNANRTLEEEGKIEKKKKKNDKRIEKKKNKSKTLTSKSVDEMEELPSDNENNVLKEKLDDRKVQEVEEAESSDDSLNIVLSSRRKNKSRRSSEQELQTKSKQKSTTGEIQCNDVDSTQDTNENNEPNEEENIKEADHTGLLEYNEYINNLYSKLKRQEASNATKDLTDTICNKESHDEKDDFDRAFSPVFNTDEPVELLQCEPSLPFLDDIVKNRKSKKSVKNIESLESNLKASNLNQNTSDRKYNVTNDIKLCQQAIVALVKLPENVAESYFKSQDIKIKDKYKNTLERCESIPSLDKNKSENSETTDKYNVPEIIDINDDESNDSNPVATFGEDSNQESLPVLPICESTNNCRKPDCDEIELEKLVKKEEEGNRLKEETSDEELKYTKNLRSRKLSKRETKEAKVENDDSKANNDNDTALLTADKVMKKDLLLLHAPVEDNELATNLSKHPTRSKRKSDGTAHKDDINADDYSSSEEEKQWVTTKEKLLKRLLRKQGDTSTDAAKRAKIVSEFIARCKTIESRKRYSRSGRSRRKNFLERQKQLSVLSRELFGETSNETFQSGKKSSQSFGKGRRNIRRVIDKKSLAKSTLLANIEEIERKRRLLHRQNKLREILGCEEGVNVVVINDEVCLEYDFEENRPVVTVHPFFTQVMKVHQYEGVKFMWDACFESLELVGEGHPGGGCILAHCMGLGKTLQVLALLHTVLTHPRVGMQRVLVVCPLSTVLNWVDEINKWMGPVNDTIKVFELSKLKKTYERAYQLEDWYTGGGIFIMGYEMFRNLSTLDERLDDIRPTIIKKIRTALLNPGPDMIICDEGHLLKNDSSVLAVAISRITTKRRIVLTGTPMQNNLREYYCMVNFVKPNLLGLYSEYANRFENPIMNGQHRDSREEDIKLMKARTHILHKVLEGCLQRQEAAVLYPYLPKKHELIFSTSLFTMDALEYFLKKIKKWSLGHEYYRLDGSVPAEVRQNWCREFNSPNNNTTNLFLISTRAGCLGLNMTAANRVIILDTSWNPAHDIQSIFRVYRFGQKKDCYIYRLVAMGTMEQKIYERSVTKQAVACRVVDSQQIDRHYNMDELTELYNFDETGSGVESGVAAGVTDVALLRVARDAPLHAVYEHDSLLRDSHDQQLPEHERAAAWRQFEMEQGHSQMANLENNSSIIPTKNIHGPDYDVSPSVALDATTSTNTKPKSKRGRKPKQKLLENTVTEENAGENLVINEESSSVDQFNLTEVQQIKNILVEQNAQNDFSDTNNIENLVNHVQKVVEARLKGEKFRAAPLVESLAQVFLQMKGKDFATTSIQMPTTSVVEDEHATSEDNPKTYKNSKRKNQIGTHKANNIIHDVDEDDSIGEIKKRKAAVKAKEYIDSLNLKDTKDTKDDENWSQEQNNTNLDTRQSKGNQNESNDEFDQAIDLRSGDEMSFEDDTSADKIDKSKTVMVEIPDDGESTLKSIILSDDETVIEVDKPEATNTKDCDKVQDNEDERIPLHASLLINEHFIKMIAYKYMEGNPVLDIDAALHAARYSAQKALKEINETGNNLYGGPLYDIAVKSIGLDTLKRLQNFPKKNNPESHSTKDNKDSSKNEPVISQSEDNQANDDVIKSKRVYKNKSELTKESVSSKRHERISSTDSDDLVILSDEVICENPKNKKSISTKTQETQRESLKTNASKANEILNPASTSAPAPPPVTSKKFETSSVSKLRSERDMVVPIQLIKSSSNATITMTRPTIPLAEESILPDDDDDVCYINDTPPAASTSNNTSTSLVISEVRSGDISLTQPVPTTKSNVLTIDSEKVPYPVENPLPSIDVDNELTEAIRNIHNVDNSDKNENSITICLDSDDEDDIVSSKETQASSQPQPPPNPVFISVTPTNTIASPSTISNTTVNTQSQISKTTTTLLFKPTPTIVPFSQLQSAANITNLLNSGANNFYKPGDMIKINQNGEIFLLNPNQTTLTRLSTSPTAIHNSPTIVTQNPKVGNIAINTLQINTPKPKTSMSRKVPPASGTPEQNKPISYPPIAPKLTIIPLQMKNSKNKSSVVPEKRTIEIYYPNKKIRVPDTKRNNEVVSEFLDLTDIDQNDVPKTAANIFSVPNVGAHTSNTKSGVSVVGSPKDFMFVRAGDKTKLETTTSRKRKEPTMPALGQYDFKKKLTTEVAGPSKKTKISSFDKLSLHDFNIDKIDDDIIELE